MGFLNILGVSVALLLAACSGGSEFKGASPAQQNTQQKGSDGVPPAPVTEDVKVPEPEPEPEPAPVDTSSQGDIQYVETVETPESPVSESTPRGNTAVSSVGSEIIAVNLNGCVRNAGCALRGSKYGQYHPNLAADKAIFAVNEVVSLDYSGMRGIASDWITVVPSHFEDNSWCQWFWAGADSGKYRFTGLPAGAYELRAYYGWKNEGECEVIARYRFDVK